MGCAILCRQGTGLHGKLWLEYFSGTPGEQMAFSAVRGVLSYISELTVDSKLWVSKGPCGQGGSL